LSQWNKKNKPTIIVNAVKPDERHLMDWIIHLTEQFISETKVYSQLGFSSVKYREYVKMVLEGNDGVCLIAHDGVKAYGYTLFYAENTYIEQTNCEIVTMYVCPEARGWGVGRALVEETTRIVDANDVAYSQISICGEFEQDGEMMDMLTENLYKKFGFKRMGVILGRKGKSWDLSAK
tara:strand:- start:3527 stop:4060 length:534 start_codon:yes stop_codon:yes gene_type:complete